MKKLWLNNEIVDRLAMLQQTEAGHPSMNQVAIEKDWWATVTLKALFQTDCRDSLTFKGGTSLSKGFNIIERFSEDIDLAISHSFFGIESTSKSQRDKLRKMARAYIHETLSSQLDARLKDMDVSGYSIENVCQVQDKNGEWRPIDSDKDPTVILLHYPSILGDTINYIPPVFVMRYPNHELPNQRPTDIVPVAEGPYAALFSRAWHGRVWCMSKHTSS